MGIVPSSILQNARDKVRGNIVVPNIIFQQKNRSLEQRPIPPTDMHCPRFLDNCGLGQESIGMFLENPSLEVLLDWIQPKPFPIGDNGRSVISIKRDTMGGFAIQGTAAGNPADPTNVPFCEPGPSAERYKGQTIEFNKLTQIDVSTLLLKNGGEIDLCNHRPRYFIDRNGNRIPIDDPATYERAVLSELMFQEMMKYAIIGKSSNGDTQSDGLLQILSGQATAYQNTAKPFQLDWGGNPPISPDGLPMAGITLNGVPLAEKYRINLFNALNYLVQTISAQSSYITTGRPLSSGDVALWTPHAVRSELTHAAACHKLCKGDIRLVETVNGQVSTRSDIYMTGGLGYGHINLYGIDVPFIPYDPILRPHPVDGSFMETALTNGDGTYNAALLTKGRGTDQTLNLHYVQQHKNKHPVSRPTRYYNDGLYKVTLEHYMRCDYYAGTAQFMTSATAPCDLVFVTRIAGDSLPICNTGSNELLDCDQNNFGCKDNSEDS